jgi:hypothetical protein
MGTDPHGSTAGYISSGKMRRCRSGGFSLVQPSYFEIRSLQDPVLLIYPSLLVFSSGVIYSSKRGLRRREGTLDSEWNPVLVFVVWGRIYCSIFEIPSRLLVDAGTLLAIALIVGVFLLGSLILLFDSPRRWTQVSIKTLLVSLVSTAVASSIISASYNFSRDLGREKIYIDDWKESLIVGSIPWASMQRRDFCLSNPYRRAGDNFSR